MGALRPVRARIVAMEGPSAAEIRRAAKALALGAMLGAVMAWLAGRPRAEGV